MSEESDSRFFDLADSRSWASSTRGALFSNRALVNLRLERLGLKLVETCPNIPTPIVPIVTVIFTVISAANLLSVHRISPGRKELDTWELEREPKKPD